MTCVPLPRETLPRSCGRAHRRYRQTSDQAWDGITPSSPTTIVRRAKGGWITRSTHGQCGKERRSPEVDKEFVGGTNPPKECLAGDGGFRHADPGSRPLAAPIQPCQTPTPPPLANPTIAGAGRVTQELRSCITPISDEDDLANATCSHCWLANDDSMDAESLNPTNITIIRLGYFQ